MVQNVSVQTTYQKYFGEFHNQLRQTTKRFVDKEIKPHIDEWEDSGQLPRELYEKAGELGLLGIGYPEDIGGIEGDIFATIAVTEEVMRAGSGGLVASLGSHGIALPPIVHFGTDEQKERFVTPVLAGEKIAALGITEPGGGSDVANLTTSAERDGDYYVVNGSKTFITNGGVADFVTTAVRTGEDGAQGVSLLVIEKGMEGFTTSTPLEKMGWHASNTAQLFFQDVRVPVENRIGEENFGFYMVMMNFQMERLQMAIMANMTAEIAYEEALRYVKEREAFGRPIIGFQVIRHKLVDMATRVEISKEYTYRIAAMMGAGEDCVTEISMAKNFACEVADFVTDQAVQLFGGYGYMREYMVERLYRDSRILSIGGGTTEIMKEIISKRIL